jgi:enamine deaminase RidA (YjgF/YER057c/UK114 family)
MARKFVSSGSSFEQKAGYARAVIDGDWVFVSGTTGFDYGAMTISDDVVEQTEQCFRNIERALKQAGATITDMVRIRVYLVDARDFERVVPVIGRWCGPARPANTTVLAGLVDPRMKIEIEVTARKQTGGT